MRIKTFEYKATGVELNLTNDETTILRVMCRNYLDDCKEGMLELDPLIERFVKKVLAKTPKD